MSEEHPVRTPENCNVLCSQINEQQGNWIVPLETPGTSAMVYTDQTYGDDYLTRAREEFFVTEVAQDVAEAIWGQLSPTTTRTEPSFLGGANVDVPIETQTAADSSATADIPDGLKSGIAQLTPSQIEDFVNSAYKVTGIVQAIGGNSALAALVEAVQRALAPFLDQNGMPIGSVSFNDLLATLVSTMISALENLLSAFMESKTKNDSGPRGSGGSGAPELILEIEPENKALEFLNELDFFYQELTATKPSPETPHVEPEFWVPLFFGGGATLMDFDVPLFESLSRMVHTYDGYVGGVNAYHYPVGAPQISPRGIYSFMDNIDQDLRKVKHLALKSMSEAQLLLRVLPWLFTTNPNRAREANRRARHLKQKLFLAISRIPSMLDLWDGLGEWTTPYKTLNELDKSQLKIEMWGDYLGGTPKHPQLTRDSIRLKHFSEDRLAIQRVYNKTNNFMQYCMANAWNWGEKVERAPWNEITTYYKTKNMMWVGERLKGDMFYHLVVQNVANPYPIALTCIGLSKYLIEYIVRQTEIVKIKTYDLTGLEDLRHLSYHDYRGYKRVVPFERLDRSALDVIEDE